MTTEPLHVGIVIDSLVVPKWIARCVDAILGSGAAEISLVIVNVAPSVAPAASAGEALYRLFERLDRRRNRLTDDPLDPEDLAASLSSIRQLRIATGDGASAEDLQQVRAAGLDVLLNLSDGQVGSAARETARLGVWSHDFTDVSPDGLTIDPRLVRETESGIDILYRSPTALHDTSPVRARPNVYYKAAAFAARVLRSMQRDGSGASGQAAEPARLDPKRPQPMRRLAQIARRIATNRLAGRQSRNQWTLGIKLREPHDRPGPCLSLDDFTPIIPPEGRFWADPFPFEHDGRRYVFFEDYPYAAGKGHLSLIEIDDHGNAGDAREVMTTDFHLSFPNVFAHDGAIYMLPETSAARQVRLYRCERFPDRWTLASVLLDNIVAFDPVVFARDDRWWMFVGTQETGTIPLDEVSLFHAPNLLGPWTAHGANPVRSTVFGARPAGNVYAIDEQLMRPAQDCSRRYGYGLVINRVEHITEQTYSETEVARILPEKHGFLGVHTINHNERFTVADFLRQAPSGGSR